MMSWVRCKTKSIRREKPLILKNITCDPSIYVIDHSDFSIILHSRFGVKMSGFLHISKTLLWTIFHDANNTKLCN